MFYLRTMDLRVTIKDIAEAAGVSISSVHLALNNKKGLSDSTRARIIAVARELNYKPNYYASNLKKENRNIYVFLPRGKNTSRFHFDFMWDAANEYKRVAMGYNILVTPFSCREMKEVLREKMEEIDGIVSVGQRYYYDSDDIRLIQECQRPLILLDSDLPESGRICCFQANETIVGRVTAELLSKMIRSIEGRILVLGAGPSYDNRRETESAIESVFSENSLLGKLDILNYAEADDECQASIIQYLQNNRVIGACSVNTRSTLILTVAVEKTGRMGMFPVIGNGLFAESKEALRSGTLTALVDKDPYGQCRQALVAMINLLTMGSIPQKGIVQNKIEIICRETLEHYENTKVTK